jgi:mycofactocin precursor
VPDDSAAPTSVPAAPVSEADAGPMSPDVAAEVLVEDVSIDGMCGVY